VNEDKTRKLLADPVMSCSCGSSEFEADPQAVTKSEIPIPNTNRRLMITTFRVRVWLSSSTEHFVVPKCGRCGSLPAPWNRRLAHRTCGSLVFHLGQGTIQFEPTAWCKARSRCSSKSKG